MIGGIRTCLEVSDDPMFLWISSNSCPLNLLLVQSHQAEIIIVRRLIQGCNNVTRVWVKPKPLDRKVKWFGFIYALPLNHKISKSNFCVKLLSCKRNFFSRIFWGNSPENPPKMGPQKINFFEWLKLECYFFMISTDTYDISRYSYSPK